MTEDVVFLCGVRVPNGDGTECVHDVYLPASRRRPAATVVTRTMYGRQAHRAEGKGWAQRGFAYVVGDVRGRYDSDGVFTPYRSERADGAALVDFVVGQSWSDGTVVAYGGSYAAYTAWSIAVKRPLSVRAVVSLCPSMELAVTKFDPSGILRLYEHLGWWLRHGDARVSRTGMPSEVLSSTDAYLDLPVREAAARTGVHVPTWADVLDRGPNHLDDQRVTSDELSRLDVPSLHVAGWYDLVTETSVEHFETVGSSVSPRPPRRLLIGPWTHDLFTDPTGAHGTGAVVDWGSLCVQWLRDALAGHGDGPTAATYDLGSHRWIDTESPTPTDSIVVLHATGDARLSVNPPGEPNSVSFSYDPADPYPTMPAYADRSSNDRRDVVEFVSGPTVADLHISGVPTATITTDTTGADADWVVRLLVRTPDDAVRQISYGVGVTTAGIATVRISLSRSLFTVPPGSELLLHITGSDFPALARTTNTGDRYTSTSSAPSTQTIHTGGEHHTSVSIPIAEGPS